jgi:S-(hydroxymethyl)glutathione dehydrogenase / alcohol dehydrogenase
MKTSAAVLYGANDLRVEQLAMPTLQPGQVLVDMAYSGICRSQLLEILGMRGEDRFLPHTLGHEGSGKVVDVGDGVKKVKKGDHVVLTWIKGKGVDVPSTKYQLGNQSINSGRISTFMNRTITCENRAVSISKKMPLREAALLGCMIPTGAGIVTNTARLRKGQSVIVFGVGGIGLSVLLAAKQSGANPLIAIDIIDEKLNRALKTGATHALNATKSTAVERIREILGAEGADVVVEAAGKIETMETAFRVTRAGGGLCILAGNLKHGDRIKIDPFDLIRGKRIVGTWGGETDPDRDIPRFVDQYMRGDLELESLITHEYQLKDINAAVGDLDKGKVGRAALKLS